MAKFATEERIAVQVPDDPHVIHIRAKLNVGQESRVIDAITDASGSVRLGAMNAALLEAFIVGWSGPEFDSVAVTPETIAQLDPTDPLVIRVVEEVMARNPLLSRASAPAGGNTSTSAGGSRLAAAGARGRRAGTTST